MGIFNITESEKKEILNLHNNAKLLKEQSTAPLDDKAKIMKIQELLKTKYNANLGNSGPKKDGIDGILGQNTLTALSNAMKSTQASADKFKDSFSQMSKSFENTPKTLLGTNTDTGTQPAPAATTQPAPAATTQPAPTAQLTPQQIRQQSRFDQRLARQDRRTARRAQQ